MPDVQLALKCKFCGALLKEKPDRVAGDFLFFRCDECGLSNVEIMFLPTRATR